MQTQHLKKILKPLGVVLTIVSLWYLASSFFENSAKIIEAFKQPLFIMLFIVSLFIYAITLLIIVFTWYLQMYQKYPKLFFNHYFYVMAVSQIGKYLPGNVFHIAGRFLMSKNLGLTTKDITNSFLFETVLVIFSALIVGSIYLYDHNFPVFKVEINFHLVVILLLLSVTAYLYFGVTESIKQLLSIKKVVIIMAAFILSHFLLGAIIYIYQYSLFNENSSFLFLTSAIAISFVLGYITPGSPAGIGIREFVFIKLVTVEIQESTALSLIITLRIVSIAGDFILYFIAKRLKPKQISISH